jgi:hydrogenase nickel incorporation protein HypA/HybF
MHELGITREVVEIVCRKAEGRRVVRVVLEIGRLTVVLPDAVRFCFELCCEESVAEGAKLEIVEIPARARCRSCGAEIVRDQPFGMCPCGSCDLEWLAGDELRVREIEVQDSPPPAGSTGRQREMNKV